ncbi:MAG: two-component sensor histidine kinase [Lachnospiraceae bacterium]|nr:two-component sensor histidine kinase [Lachnospiraceae bacterium]
MTCRKKGNYSIKTHIFLIFVGLIGAAFFICWIITRFLLDDYYLYNKEKDMLSAYLYFDIAATKGILTDDRFSVEWQKMCNRYNIDVVILDSDSETILTSIHDEKLIINRLMNYMFSENTDDETKIIRERDHYKMQIITDKNMQGRYLEIWGVLDNGNPILIRSAVENMEDTAKSTSMYLLVMSMAAVTIGAMVSFGFARGISYPVRRLTQLSEDMSNLKFDAKYQDESRICEINELGEHMNKLSEKLEQTICELKMANSNLQEDIQEKEKMDEARRTFLSDVSHELKTPIALIQGYAEGLKEGILDDDESKDYYYDVILDEATKMNEMVQRLLTLNQLEAGFNQVEYSRFDMVELIQNYLQNADVMIKQEKVTVRLRNTEPIYVWADEYMVEKVVANYFTNALHYAAGEKIVDIKVEEKGDKAVFSVFNTGEPIPEDALPHIWEKFYKVDKSRSREYGGNGVGLSIVKAVAELMKVNYGATNYDNGVEFWMELDLH